MADNENNQTVGNNFVEFLVIVVKYRWFLFLFIFSITCCSIVYALFIADKWYKATASVLPAEKTDLLSTLSGLSGLAKGFSASKGLAALTGSNEETDRYMAILLSATVTDDIIKRFDLRKEYDMRNDYYDKVVEEWKSNFELEIMDEGNLSITVFDKNPNKAAQIANYLVTKLNHLNTKISGINAKSNKEFIEKRYFQNLEDITILESRMKEFQQKYGVIAVPEQIEATVKSMSEIYVEYYRKEVEENVLKERFGDDSPFFKNAEIERKELEKKINSLNTGKDNTQKDTKLLIPFKQAPELGNEYFKIYRNLEIQYKILEFIQPFYEQAKVEESRNTPSVLVLDQAKVPDRKAKPNGSLFALISFVLSSLFGLTICLTIEFFQKLKIKNPNKYRAIFYWAK